MTKEDFIKKFPDVKVQQFETAVVFSYREAQETVNAACTSLGMGLIYGTSRSKNNMLYFSKNENRIGQNGKRRKTYSSEHQ